MSEKERQGVKRTSWCAITARWQKASVTSTALYSLFANFSNKSPTVRHSVISISRPVRYLCGKSVALGDSATVGIGEVDGICHFAGSRAARAARLAAAVCCHDVFLGFDGICSLGGEGSASMVLLRDISTDIFLLGYGKTTSQEE